MPSPRWARWKRIRRSGDLLPRLKDAAPEDPAVMRRDAGATELTFIAAGEGRRIERRSSDARQAQDALPRFSSQGKVGASVPIEASVPSTMPSTNPMTTTMIVNTTALSAEHFRSTGAPR